MGAAIWWFVASRWASTTSPSLPWRLSSTRRPSPGKVCFHPRAVLTVRNVPGRPRAARSDRAGWAADEPSERRSGGSSRDSRKSTPRRAATTLASPRLTLRSVPVQHPVRVVHARRPGRVCRRIAIRPRPLVAPDLVARPGGHAGRAAGASGGRDPGGPEPRTRSASANETRRTAMVTATGLYGGHPPPGVRRVVPLGHRPQVLLCNPLAFPYSPSSAGGFHAPHHRRGRLSSRIFGQPFLEYKSRVWSGIPLVR